MRALVVFQIAAAMVLLTSAGGLLRTFVELQRIDSGVNPERVLVFRVGLPEQGYQAAGVGETFAERLRETLAAVPGVVSAGLATDGYVIGSAAGSSLNAVDGVPIRLPEPGDPDWERAIQRTAVWYRTVSVRFLGTLQVQVLRGRAFTIRDLARPSRVAVVSRAFARLHFGARDPLGHHIDIDGDREIIGVVSDVRSRPTLEPPAEVYLLPDGLPRSTVLVGVVKATTDPLALVPSLRDSLARLDSRLTMYDVSSMTDWLDRSMVTPRFYAWLSLSIAAVAVSLACVGLYGLLAYAVTRRRQEFAVRMALGAERRAILADVMRQGLSLAVVGLAIGALSVYYVAQFLEVVLFHVTLFDPLTVGAVSLLLLTISLVASYVPARRATLVDPLVVLRWQ